MRFAKICSVIAIIALIAVLFAGLSTSVAAMTWTGGTLDSAAGSSSIAVDSTGAPKICYSTVEGLKYAEWIHGTSTTPEHWEYAWIDHTAGMGAYCDIALYPNGDPAVCYRDDVNHALKFAWRNPQGVWGPGTLDNGYNIKSSIAIGTDGREQICYHIQEGPTWSRNLKFAEWIFGTPDGHWDIKAIAHGDVQEHCSIALDKNNNPYISYTGDRTGGGSDVRFIYRIGSSLWQTQYVSGSSSGAYEPSIAVDQVSGKVCISYEAYHSIYYVERNPTTGTWSNPTKVAVGNSYYSSLALDKNKRPAISYVAPSGLGFAYRDAAGWHTQTADDGGSSHATVLTTAALAIGSGNIPSISYWDSANAKLKYIEGHAEAAAMTCTVTPSLVVLNQAFTVKGTLTRSGAAGAALSKEAVHLERRTYASGAWGAWANVAGTTRITPANGTVSTSQKLATLGTYQYRWHYTGSIAYFERYSPAVTVTVKKPTTFTIATSTTTPTTSVPFTLTGTLKSGTTALKYQYVHLERRTYASGAWGSWANVAGTSQKTDSTGVIKLSQTMSTAGTYQYRWHYTGTTTYKAAYSAAVTETVKKPTTTTITASDTTPVVKQQVTFTVTLKSSTTGLSKPVHLWCTFNGVPYERGTFNTVNGVYTFTGPFSSKGQVIYHADFAGDSTYKASSDTVTVNVG